MIFFVLKFLQLIVITVVGSSCYCTIFHLYSERKDNGQTLSNNNYFNYKGRSKPWDNSY